MKALQIARMHREPYNITYMVPVYGPHVFLNDSVKIFSANAYHWSHKSIRQLGMLDHLWTTVCVRRALLYPKSFIVLVSMFDRKTWNFQAILVRRQKMRKKVSLEFTFRLPKKAEISFKELSNELELIWNQVNVFERSNYQNDSHVLTHESDNSRNGKSIKSEPKEFKIRRRHDRIGHRSQNVPCSNKKVSHFYTTCGAIEQVAF